MCQSVFISCSHKESSMENKELRQPPLPKTLGRESAVEIYSIVILASVALGLALAVLSRTWIEAVFGVDPDGGSGLMEYLLILVPIGISIVLAACRLCRFLSHAACVTGASLTTASTNLFHL